MLQVMLSQQAQRGEVLSALPQPSRARAVLEEQCLTQASAHVLVGVDGFAKLSSWAIWVVIPA